MGECQCQVGVVLVTQQDGEAVPELTILFGLLGPIIAEQGQQRLGVMDVVWIDDIRRFAMVPQQQNLLRPIQKRRVESN